VSRESERGSEGVRERESERDGISVAEKSKRWRKGKRRKVLKKNKLTPSDK